MLTLYFSGTGNTKYILEQFSNIMQADCHSIEEDENFKALIDSADTIAFGYPVYGSCVPLIMREFVIEHKACLDGKNLIILCTQMLFSGDGARVFTDLLTGIHVNVVYAEHFNMPNNICNFFLFPVKNKDQIKSVVEKTDKKVYKACENIKKGVVRKRGFNVFSKYLGLISQRGYFGVIEKKARKDVRINPDCNVCRKCITVCPRKNLVVMDKRVQQRGECTLCYRCINICPQKAITVYLHSKVNEQYRGF